jgi:hypothetical protein
LTLQLLIFNINQQTSKHTSTMSTEPGHSNAETHMTMDGEPDKRFKEVSILSLPSFLEFTS